MLTIGQLNRRLDLLLTFLSAPFCSLFNFHYLLAHPRFVLKSPSYSLTKTYKTFARKVLRFR